MKKIIFSGIMPTGNIHIGNYLGAVKNWVALQDNPDYHCYFAVMDLHAMTGNRESEELRGQILRTAAELIAAGIDPDKCTFFVQSHVAEHAELAWMFNTVTPVGELERMTQFKDKAGLNNLLLNTAKTLVENAKNDKVLEKVMGNLYEEGNLIEFVKEFAKVIEKERSSKASAGLLTYPVLQAADILLYKGTHVPVGQDQIQHVELTRDIARWFNNKYEDYFPETEALLTEIPKVMSLLEPNAKMSKSKGEGHVIELADEPEVILKKMKKAVTATEGGENSPGVENLLLLLKQFGDEKAHAEFVEAEKDGSIRYGDLKSTLATAIADHFADFRARRRDLLDNHDELAEILMKGAEKASDVARATMEDVRKMVGIR